MKKLFTIILLLIVLIGYSQYTAKDIEGKYVVDWIYNIDKFNLMEFGASDTLVLAPNGFIFYINPDDTVWKTQAWIREERLYHITGYTPRAYFSVDGIDQDSIIVYLRLSWVRFRKIIN